jgi:hypothetical protein
MNDDLSNPALQQTQEGHIQTLEHIKQLEKMEKNLYDKLKRDSANNKSSPEEETATIKKINEIATMRMNLFNSMQIMYNSMQNTVAGSRVNLVDQLTLSGVVDQELQNAQKTLNSDREDTNNKKRMVEINTYYGKRYKAYSDFMKLLIYICVPLLILAILKKKGLVPDMVTYGLGSLVLLVGGYYFLWTIIDITWRDKMNFDSYDWYFDPNKNTPSVIEYNREQWNKSNIWGGVQSKAQELASNINVPCIGEACCSAGMTYNEEKKSCMVEGFSTSRKHTSVVHPFIGSPFAENSAAV